MALFLIITLLDAS